MTREPNNFRLVLAAPGTAINPSSSTLSEVLCGFAADLDGLSPTSLGLDIAAPDIPEGCQYVLIIKRPGQPWKIRGWFNPPEINLPETQDPCEIAEELNGMDETNE